MKKTLFTIVMLLTAVMTHAQVQVTTFAQLIAAIQNNDNILLKNDITLTAADNELFKTYQKNYGKDNSYKGTFDGDDYTITGLNVDCTSGPDYCGLFCSAYQATIKNITLKDVNIKHDNQYLGALCGSASNCTFENCHVSGTLSDDYYKGDVGGIVGYFGGGSIINCSADVTVTSNGPGVGGIAGVLNSEVTVDGCSVSGSIYGDGYLYEGNVGGIAGKVGIWSSKAIIKNCTNSATVTSKSNNVGGIIGLGEGDSRSNPLTISNCTNNGDVTCSGKVYDNCAGGIFGFIEDFMEDLVAVVECCTNNGAIHGDNYIGGIGGQAENQVTVTNCYSHGGVWGSSSSVGAVVGYLGSDASITNCFTDAVVMNSGSISSRWGAGTTKGTVRNTFYRYIDTTTGNVYGNITDVEISSGKLTYLLNGQKSNDNNAWHQNIDNGLTKDDIPVICYTTEQKQDHGVVYHYDVCFGKYDIGTEYLSNSSTGTDKGHKYDISGTYCLYCGYRSAGYWEIGSANDLVSYMKSVNNYNISQNAYITADIDLTGATEWTNPIGTEDKPYRATLFGQGHTITLSQNFGSNNYSALFGCTEDAYICNLKVNGTIATNGKFAAGIVGHMIGLESVITNCISDVTINSTTNGDGSHGGIVGYDECNKLYMLNCLAEGVMNLNSKTTNCAGLVGWKASDKDLYLENCLQVMDVQDKVASDASATMVRYMTNIDGLVLPTYTNCYYLHAFGTEQGEAVTNADLFSGKVGSDLSWAQDLQHGFGYTEYDKDNLPVPIAFNENGISHSRAITNEWGTVCLPFDFDINDYEDQLTFYIPTSVSIDGTEGTLHLLKITDGLQEAGTPLLFKRNDDSVSKVIFKRKGSDFDTSEYPDSHIFVYDYSNSWKYKGLYKSVLYSKADLDAGLADRFFVANDKFWQATEAFTLDCYRVIFGYENSVNVNLFTLQVDDETPPTAITNVEGDDDTDGTATAGHNAIYNLQGQRLAQPRHGQINIINGKKVMVK